MKVFLAVKIMGIPVNKSGLGIVRLERLSLQKKLVSFDKIA
jgi:hypothetical protein